MSTVITHPTALSGTKTFTRARIPRVPWYIWTGAAAVTSSSIGGAWDVSWHRSIGRDTFWTPAHMMIYLCGVLAGIVGVWLVARATTGTDPELRAESVSVLGLRAPLGVFLAGWGGLAMMTSAPFDNWWHAAYGLDVKIVSPPHTLLILGIKAVSFGMMLLTLAVMNRARTRGDANYLPLRRIFLYLGGISVIGTMFFLQESTWYAGMHRYVGYAALGIGIPVTLAMFAVPSRYRWAATTMSAIYMASIIAEILILPLFPAVPKLGPVYYPVTHFVPAEFPILLVVPAFALDLLWQHTHKWKTWQIAAVSGLLFVAVAVAVQWPFSDFLISPASSNRFFGTGYFDYGTPPNAPERVHELWRPMHGMVLWAGLARASVYAMISTWIGLRFGGWLKGVQR